MRNPFKKLEGPSAEDLVNEIKQEIEGGVNMRNEKEQPVETPTIQEREINLTLLNDKLNYVISLCNKIAEKAGVELED